jgi:DNA polymerase-1
MIFLYSNQTTTVPSQVAVPCYKHNIIDFLNSTDTICLDSETTGLDAHREDLICLQIGNDKDQYIIDCAAGMDLSWLKPYLESKIIVGQNLKFDLKYLYKHGIYPRRIWDTFVAEKVINCGDKLAKASLDVLTQRYIGVSLDKSIRTNIKKEGLTDRVLMYAADDIKYLPRIMEEQQRILRENDLMGAMNIENRFTPVLAYIEYCGFKLDVDKWLFKMNKDSQRLREAEDKLNEWVLANGLQKFISAQLDLFEPVGCTINWSSSQQVIELFESIGLDVTVVEKGVRKKSIEASVISKYQNSHDIVKLYLEYKKAEKVVTTYGQNFIDQINPATGRLHTSFKQILDTGRISSGGQDKATGETNINFQNIPSDKETRACFVAEEGNTLIISDYSGQEQIVLANRAMDKNLLEFYDNGLADMHSFVASKMYPELEGLSLDEIKDKHKAKRQSAKSAGFAINYGGQGITIAENLGITLEEGNKIYDAYFQAFPGLKTYFEQVKKQGLKDGYILINGITRRKSYITFFQEFKDLESKMDKDFWERYRRAKDLKTQDFPALKEMVSKYFRYKGDIERKSLNFPIQGSSSEITKIAAVYIYDYILDNNLFGTVKFVNTIHDEHVIESPLNISKDIALVVEESMNKAADIYCKRVPLRAVPELSTYWKK